MRLLNLKGFAPKEALDEIVYEEEAPSYDVVTGMVKSSVVVHRWKRSQFLGNPRPSLMMPPSSRLQTAVLEVRRVTERQLGNEVKISLGSGENNM